MRVKATKLTAYSIQIRITPTLQVMRALPSMTEDGRATLNQAIRSIFLIITRRKWFQCSWTIYLNQGKIKLMLTIHLIKTMKKSLEEKKKGKLTSRKKI
jgi:membrane-anchored glycerophosphoryl diester phosphodiesterase (GDPDase)